MQRPRAGMHTLEQARSSGTSRKSRMWRRSSSQRSRSDSGCWHRGMAGTCALDILLHQILITKCVLHEVKPSLVVYRARL